MEGRSQEETQQIRNLEGGTRSREGMKGKTGGQSGRQKPEMNCQVPLLIPILFYLISLSLSLSLSLSFSLSLTHTHTLSKGGALAVLPSEMSMKRAVLKILLMC